MAHDKETGKCFVKDLFLKCIYEDKNQKQLIVNRNNLIIHIMLDIIRIIHILQKHRF